MGGLDLKDLSAQQEKFLSEVLEICGYFSSVRNMNITDATYAAQARALGSVFHQLEATKAKG